MAEIVNLRLARKQAKRSAAEAAAQRNRLAHGLPKAVRNAAAAERERSDAALDAHRLTDAAESTPVRPE